MFGKLDISLNNQKPDHAGKQKLAELLTEDIGDLVCNHFYDAVRGFYETVYNYYKKMAPTR